MPLLQYTVRNNAVSYESTTLKRTCESKRCVRVGVLLREQTNIGNACTTDKTELTSGAEYCNALFPTVYCTVYQILLLLINNLDR